jgi:hypothetical protein
MNDNLNTKQSKLTLKKTIYSLILGLISITLPFIILFWQGTGISSGSAEIFLLGMIITGTLAIVGLIFGIKGLKSTRRKLAIAGIVICSISVLFWMYLSLTWLMMGGLIWLWKPWNYWYR